jgi:hypothetical protein
MEPRIAFLDSQHFIPGVICHLKSFAAELLQSLTDSEDKKNIDFAIKKQIEWRDKNL